MIEFFLELSKIESLLIIGLAVGDTERLLKSARRSRLDKFYELAADLEVFKYQLLMIMSRCSGRYFILPLILKRQNFIGERRYIMKATKRLFKSCTPNAVQ